MKVSDLRGILQYVPRFREKIFVVAIDGEIVASPNFANLLLDLAVLRSLSIKVILVHGAGQQIAQLAAERGVTISNADGIGITDDATLKVSLEAATNVMNEITLKTNACRMNGMSRRIRKNSISNSSSSEFSEKAHICAKRM